MTAFFRLLTYVRRTVVRARLRSLLTIVGTALAIALFAFVRMLEGGVDRMEKASDQPVLVVFETSRFCPLSSEPYQGQCAAMIISATTPAANERAAVRLGAGCSKGRRNKEVLLARLQVRMDHGPAGCVVPERQIVER